ncbi:MAG: hypothetical protein ABIT01_05590 [Thermoanaerobaculia bacterium]
MIDSRGMIRAVRRILPQGRRVGSLILGVVPAALLTPALLLAQPSERILSSAEKEQKVRAIWAEMAPKLADLGLGPQKIFDPVGVGGIVRFQVMTQHQDGTYTVGTGIPMAPGEKQWTISGSIHAIPKWVEDETTYGAGTWFDVGPGARALLKQPIGEGWLVDLLGRPQGAMTSQVYYATGGGQAFFHRGLVSFSVELLRSGNSPTNSYNRGNEDHALRKQETKAIFDASISDIEALCRKLYASVPPSARTDGSLDVQLALLDPNPLYDSRRPPTGQNYSDLSGFSMGYLESNAQLLKSERVGATADGVSLLLVRAIVPVAGKVTLSLEGAGAGGTLHGVFGKKWTSNYPFDSAGENSVDVDAVPLNGSEMIAALALFKPPADFGSAGGERVFTVKAVFTAREPAKGKGEATIPLTLVRPPVVLVHGTYDNPTECWAKISPGAPPSNTITMLDRLKQEGFRVFLVDYKESSGSYKYLGPSSTFDANQQVLWAAPGGIREALEAFRKDRLAATRADVICHSLGGVLARVYLRGSLPDPRVNASRWEPVRTENYKQGDANRLMTISSTHRGSEVMELFDAYTKYTESKWNLSSLWTEIFLGYVDVVEQRITTGAPLDQIPGSGALRGVGPTRVRAHAISCIASDEDLDSYGGIYKGRAEKLWGASNAESLNLGVGVVLRNKAAARRLVAAKAAEQALTDEISQVTNQLSGSGTSYPAATTADPEVVQRNIDLRAELAKLQLTNAFAFRTVVFRGENDCTVSLTSSSGGLKPPYQTTIGHVLHGYASQYPSVQNRVLELLRSEGAKLFAPDGFPDTYAPQPGRAATWGQLLAPPRKPAQPGAAAAPR